MCFFTRVLKDCATLASACLFCIGIAMASDIRQLPQWKQLDADFAGHHSFSLKEALSQSPNRAQQFSLEAAGIFADFSKALVTPEILSHLLELAEARDLMQQIAALRSGQNINNTENRQVLHYLLRANEADVPDQLKAQFKAIQAARQQLETMSNQIAEGILLGETGKPFTDIVHIGIGGSYLGPKMMMEALQPYQRPGIKLHFVANICPTDIHSALVRLNPETTLVIVASKTFTTLETMQNANTAKAWLASQLTVDEAKLAKHFYAVTASPDNAKKWGIAEGNILPFWDWVGGRYSAMSSIGLALAIGLGCDNFERVLEGARNMDQHFFTAPFNENMPVIMAMLGIWYINFYGRDVLCIAPYDERLRSLPAYLQQLEMESNGKSVTKDGQTIDYPTCPTIFGESGTNCQHSYFQLLHQSPDFIPVDFIVTLDQPQDESEHHEWLVANAFAQAKALMEGRQLDPSDPLAAHKAMPGNRPSHTFILDELSPERLGALIALYEHKVFVQSIIWNINAFDQWGVELGKVISKQVHAGFSDDNLASAMDASTQQLMKRFKQARKN